MRIADELQVDGPVFYVDNVAEYCLAQTDLNLMDAVPCVTPPFQQLWLEWGWNSTGGVARAGAFVVAKDTPAGTPDDGAVKTRWLVDIAPAVRPVGQTLSLSPTAIRLWISDTGEMLGATEIDRKGQEIDDEERLRVLFLRMAPALLALAFMHCKNVRQVEHKPDPKWQAKRAKKGQRPILRYYTLEIDPMREVLRREGNVETVGLKQALHICRGHFKDYRQSGLFGKVKGIFWWDSQVRGTPERGAVVKDYAVKAPGGGKETIH